MINSTQALSKSETATLLALVREHNLPVEALACHMTRQQGHGRGMGPPGSFTPVFNISYNLMLCEYCGNLEPQEPACPAKLRMLKAQLGNVMRTKPLQPCAELVLNSATDGNSRNVAG